MNPFHNFHGRAKCSLVLSLAISASLTASALFGAAAPRQQAQAQLLDHAEFLCDNCFFGTSSYYYCFEADNQVLVGYQRVPVLNWVDKSKNYLTPAHAAWAAWTAPGQSVPVSYDNKNIWVSRPEQKQASADFWAHLKAIGGWASRVDSKQVRLTRSSLRDIFIHDERCHGARPGSGVGGK